MSNSTVHTRSGMILGHQCCGDPFTLLTTQHAALKSLLAAVKSEHRRAELERDPQALRSALSEFIAAASAHEAMEEAHVQGLFESKLGPTGATFFAEATQQDKDNKAELAKLDATDPADGAAVGRLLARIETALLAHMHVEETVWWPALAGQLTQPEREKLLEDLEAQIAKGGPTHPHPEGPHAPLGVKLLGPVVAMVDRAKDAVLGRN